MKLVQPPYSPDSERAVLGSILYSNQALDSVVEILRTGDFYEPRNRIIFEACMYLSQSGKGLDLVSLYNVLNDRGKLAAAGGATYVGELTDYVPPTSHLNTHCQHVKDKSLLRSLISVFNEFAAKAHENPPDVEAFLDESEAAIFDVARQKVSHSIVKVGEIVNDVIIDLERRASADGELTGLGTGYKDLDEITGGLQKAELTILAARPKMGKTALALNIARNIAAAGDPVAFFSIEMSSIKLIERLISSEAKVSTYALRKGYIKKESWENLFRACNTLKEIPIYIDDSAPLTTLELRARARRLVSEQKVKIIFVDYLQMMKGHVEKGASREREIADISQTLKNLSKQLNVPVVALSQLNRKVEDRPNKRPGLADLRESGALEQDADVVAFLFRPGVYDESENQMTTELIIAKHRNGPEGIVKLNFLGDFVKFEAHYEI